MRILISSPLYPPKLGGPSQYAFHINNELKEMGHYTRVNKYGVELKIPSFLRHIFYFLKIIPNVIWADRIIVFDASSVGGPTALACKFLKKKYVLRIGGDFLWESYVQRTKDQISLPDFYKSIPNLTLKEKIIKSIVSYALKNADKIVVNTEWFKPIVAMGYKVPIDRIVCIENFFAGVNISEVRNNIYIASSRPIVLKNVERLKKVFNEINPAPGVLITKTMTHVNLVDEIKKSYATVVASYSDVYPNLILDGIASGKPFILTKYNGLPDRFKNMGIFIDPFDEKSIREGILAISDPVVYEGLVNKIRECNYVHDWKDITKEFERIML